MFHRWQATTNQKPAKLISKANRGSSPSSCLKFFLMLTVLLIPKAKGRRYLDFCFQLEAHFCVPHPAGYQGCNEKAEGTFQGPSPWAAEMLYGSFSLVSPIHFCWHLSHWNTGKDPASPTRKRERAAQKARSQPRDGPAGPHPGAGGSGLPPSAGRTDCCLTPVMLEENRRWAGQGKTEAQFQSDLNT